MVTDALCVLIMAFFLALCAVEAGYFHKGRHRGEYVEDPRWRSYPYSVGPLTYHEGGIVTWDTTVKFSGPTSQTDVPTWTVALAPPGGLTSLPALVPGVPGEPPPMLTLTSESPLTPESVDRMAEAWVAATTPALPLPEEDHGRVGEFGDVAIDRTDSAPLWPSVSPQPVRCGDCQGLYCEDGCIWKGGQ